MSCRHHEEEKRESNRNVRASSRAIGVRFATTHDGTSTCEEVSGGGSFSFLFSSISLYKSYMLGPRAGSIKTKEEARCPPSAAPGPAAPCRDAMHKTASPRVRSSASSKARMGSVQ